jgi:hypothetical protein
MEAAATTIKRAITNYKDPTIHTIVGSTNSRPIPLEALGSAALREGQTDRSIRMTLSLAFLAPDIVKGRSREKTATWLRF